MYSNVYFSTRAEVAAFQEATYQPPPLIRFRGSGEGADDAVEARLRDLDRQGVLSDVARRIAGGRPLTEADAANVRDVTARYVAAFGAGPHRVPVLADTWRFDWSIADFTPRNEWKTIATLSLDEGTISAQHP
jgi:hypothetical protein